MDDSMNLTYNVRIHDEGPDGLWADVVELPGLFVSGQNQQELEEALDEAIGLYLSTPESRIEVQRVGGQARVIELDYERVEVPCA